MNLSVVVVNWNSGGYLAKLLTSLAPLTTSLDQVLVVDNNSTDQGWRAADSDPATDLLRLDRNAGFGAAANIGIKKSESEFILLLNPDIEVQPKSISKLYSRIVEQTDAAIVCGPLIGLSGQSQQEFQLRPLPTWWTVLKDVLFLDEVLAFLVRSPRTSDPAPAVRRVEQPAAAFWLMRKAAWQDLAGFDERFYPAWYEDVDFCKRLSKTDWQILFYPDCPVRHSGGSSLEHLGYKVFYHVYYTNLLKYLRKHHGFSYPVLWLPVKIGACVRSWRPVQ